MGLRVVPGWGYSEYGKGGKRIDFDRGKRTG